MFSFIIAFTGATGGLGLALLRWLAEKGARHVICVSRRGFTSLEQTTTLSHLTGCGVTVQQIQADVARPEDVSRVMETVRNNNCPELKVSVLTRIKPQNVQCDEFHISPEPFQFSENSLD